MVFVCKGLENGTNALPIEIIATTLGKDFARDSVFLVRCPFSFPRAKANQVGPGSRVRVSQKKLSPDNRPKSRSLPSPTFTPPGPPRSSTNPTSGATPTLTRSGSKPPGHSRICTSTPACFPAMTRLTRNGSYAIAAGCAEGLGYSNNTRAGLVTRSLNEMTRVGVAFGADPLT